ncbi:MlaD family protein [Marinobacter orientalis]|uniref:MCE family protein n=1 Tax=Marinobacter orientalis TaxID=1928859 RepID=A0A7Y0WTF6_9GAMM|nr:MlaD family protein [Marinobacter orientalis]NMT64797.1 MCE family protein [Marinobacter orientalis]TGX48788.1 MCE family protein [Marinobacter orientalis]
MEPRAHHVLIGLFTLIFLASALLFALWLGKTSADREYSWYEVIFNRGVSGLTEGSPVKYSGIEVGDVYELRLDPEDPRNVRALIRVYSDVPIKEDTRAGLALTNITGSMSIELKGGKPESRTLDGDRKSPPEIQAEPSALNTLMASSEKLFAKLDEVLSNANAMISPENARNLTDSLENIEAISSGLLEQRQELSRLVASFDQLSGQTEATLETFRRFGLTANSLLDNEGRQLFTTAQSAMDSLEATTTRLEQLTARNEGALDQGMRGAAELAPAMRELRNTLRSLNNVVYRFEDDPAGLLLGRDPIREFNP